jgi:hypothetical protein
MATVVFIAGPSGSGKSTAGRNLDPSKTMWVNADQKDLPFRGWMGKYNKENKNYIKSSNPADILAILRSMPEKAPHIKVAVIDTLNRLMTDKVMRDRHIKGFDKWSDLSGFIYDIVQLSNTALPDDMIVYILAHTEVGYSDTGAMFRKIQTAGKALDKIVLESMSTIVLFTHIKHANGKNEYFFETQTDGVSTAKSPEGMFEEYLIPNDLVLVTEAINKYKLS